MKQYNKRALIGIAVVSYDETGKPITGAFAPAEMKVDAEELEKILVVPANSSEEAVTNAQALMSSYFLKLENIETADRETSRVETAAVSCANWPNGKPKFCEIAFYFVTNDPSQRVLTGVR